MTIKRRQILAAGGAALLAVRHPAFAQTPADWPSVIEAAKKEGQLFVYSANVGNPTQGAIGKAFEQKYGIKVEILEARASELRERIRTEQAAGRYIGDLSHNGATTTALQAKVGTFQPYGSLPSSAKIRAPFKADELRVPAFAHAYSILVNTNLVKAGDEPKSWKDLADPKWKGKILSDDMRALGGGSVLFFVTEEHLGRAFHDKLAQNQPVFSRDLRASELRLARGEYTIWIPQQISSFLALKGLPVKLLAPEEGYPFIAYELAMLKNAPHPNATRLFMEFYLGNEAQLIHAHAGNIVVTGEAAAAVPAELRAYANGKLFGTTDASRQDEMLRLAKEIYK
jgi:iron(III) transport system substrate-binding protein